MDIPETLSESTKVIVQLATMAEGIMHDSMYPIEMREVSAGIVGEALELKNVIWEMQEQIRINTIFVITRRPIGVYEITEKHEIRGAKDGEEALAQLRVQYPDVDRMEYEHWGTRFTWEEEPDWLKKIELTRSWGIPK